MTDNRKSMDPFKKEFFIIALVNVKMRFVLLMILREYSSLCTAMGR